MRGAIIHGAHDVRVEERPQPSLQEPTDAVVRVTATCVCGSDLWRSRGISPVPSPTPIGHEFVGVVEEVGEAVTSVRPGDFVVGPFRYSCGECPLCRAGNSAACPNGGGYDGCQAEYVRVPQANGTLLPTPGAPDDDLVDDLLALSDVMATGWHAAVSAGVGPGRSAVVVGDGAVGLCAVLACRELGAETIVAMSRHADRQALAREFGATHVVAERGADGIAAVRELTEGVGADCALECVGTQEARDQCVGAVRDGGMIGLVGVPHGSLDPDALFWRNVGVNGGIAHARSYLPHLMELVWSRRIEPGRVFDATFALEDIAEAYAAMDERHSIKALVRP